MKYYKIKYMSIITHIIDKLNKNRKCIKLVIMLELKIKNHYFKKRAKYGQIKYIK